MLDTVRKVCAADTEKNMPLQLGADPVVRIPLSDGHPEYVAACTNKQFLVLTKEGSFAKMCDDLQCPYHRGITRLDDAINPFIGRMLAQFFEACPPVVVKHINVNNHYYGSLSVAECVDMGELNQEHKEFFDKRYVLSNMQRTVFDKRTWESFSIAEFIIAHGDMLSPVPGTKRLTPSGKLWIRLSSSRCWRVDYSPGDPPILGHEDEYPILNSWLPRGPAPAEDGDCSLFYESLALTLGSRANADFHLDVFAWLAQNPGKKPTWAYQLVGRSGDGKTSAFDVPARALYGDSSCDDEYLMVDNKSSAGFGKFQESMRNKRVVLYDDIAKDPKLYNQLKNNITADKRVIKRKFKGDEIIRDRCFFTFTNNDGNVFEIEDENDRRHVGLDLDKLGSFRDESLPPRSTSATERAAAWKKVYEQLGGGGLARLRYDLERRPLSAADRPDGLDFDLSSDALVDVLPPAYAAWREIGLRRVREAAMVRCEEKEADDEIRDILTLVRKNLHNKAKVSHWKRLGKEIKVGEAQLLAGIYFHAEKSVQELYPARVIASLKINGEIIYTRKKFNGINTTGYFGWKTSTPIPLDDLFEKYATEEQKRARQSAEEAIAMQRVSPEHDVSSEPDCEFVSAFIRKYGIVDRQDFSYRCKRALLNHPSVELREPGSGWPPYFEIAKTSSIEAVNISLACKGFKILSYHEVDLDYGLVSTVHKQLGVLKIIERSYHARQGTHILAPVQPHHSKADVVEGATTSTDTGDTSPSASPTHENEWGETAPDRKRGLSHVSSPAGPPAKRLCPSASKPSAPATAAQKPPSQAEIDEAVECDVRERIRGAGCEQYTKNVQLLESRLVMSYYEEREEQVVRGNACDFKDLELVDPEEEAARYAAEHSCGLDVARTALAKAYAENMVKLAEVTGVGLRYLYPAAHAQSDCSSGSSDDEL